MNYYEHHIGDYIKATAHLSMVEDAAYRRLLDVYYTREAPLPLDRKAVQKLARAQSKDERAAVDYVLDEFFVQHDDGWRQSRCDEEIARYLEKAPRAAEKRDNAKERQQRARQRRAAMFEKLRSHGVTPSWDTKTADLETLLSQVQERTRHAPVTRDDTATQSPDTRHQVNPRLQSAAFTEPELDATGAAPQPATPGIDPITSRAIELAGLLRQRGASLTATHPEVRRWAAEGVSDADALKALEIAQQRRADRSDPSPIPAGYLTPILADITNPNTGGPNHGKPRRPSAADRRASVIAELTGANRRAAQGEHDSDERTLPGEARVVR